jgi:hypothetical protein
LLLCVVLQELVLGVLLGIYLDATTTDATTTIPIMGGMCLVDPQGGLVEVPPTTIIAPAMEAVEAAPVEVHTPQQVTGVQREGKLLSKHLPSPQYN